MTRIAALIATATLAFAVSGCSSADAKEYDISPIFPLSSDTCEKYHGDENEDGSCLVTKSECERAAADWREAMTSVEGAIQFSC